MTYEKTQPQLGGRHGQLGRRIVQNRRYFDHVPAALTAIFSLTLSMAGLAQETAPTDQPEGADTTAQAAAKPSARAPVIRDFTIQMLAERISQQGTNTSVEWLESEGVQLLLLTTKAHTANPKGWLVMLPDTNQHPAWPDHLGPLSQGLAEHGWTALALSLPPLPQPPASNRMQEQTDQQAARAAEEPTTAPDRQPESEPVAPWQVIQAATTQALAREAIQEQQVLVFLGVGQGGYWASRLASEYANSGYDSLVLITLDAHNQLPGENSAASVAAVPTLDLVTPRSRPERAAAARQRLIAAQQAGHQHYRQGKWQQERADALINRVRGYLEGIIQSPK